MKNSADIIKQVLLTEKGTRLSEEQNKYLFRVSMDANKVEIKRAVEELFNVRVMAVNTMRRKGKKKRQRTAHFGMTAAWKRAVVTLNAEDSINLI
ncbi:50S ribosomal protein L23 [Pontiella sulfatireligans]|uniref:Large ribosomal subunit protein uL23 n=1 Tax=Pontiella sulfatireligans TaxID=2750658 RepID=A0A6C2UKQ1_9BACT|nr:50S ribosomal protein L23 [Pontiella sulfatireligans]VGO20549.1 50S ribosomal protein L23 [Pontiella sulfatireligans]